MGSSQLQKKTKLMADPVVHNNDCFYCCGVITEPVQLW